jgi:predicted transcriptional regulator
LAILNVLWRRGPSTVRDIHAELGPQSRTGYTTTLKLLQIMTVKKLVRRDEASRSHVYEAALSQERTQRQLIHDLLDRAFSGSAAKLVMQALATKRASAAELAQVKNLIDQMKEGKSS